MNKQRFFLCVLFSLICLRLLASDVRIDHIEWFRSNQSRTTKALVQITWQNSWNNSKNHDAVWLFFKYQNALGNPYRHARLLATGHRLVDKAKEAPEAAVEVADDGTGVFIYPRSAYRGAIQWTMEFTLDSAIYNDRAFNPGVHTLTACAIEMVYIPDGPFELGSADSLSVRNHSFFQSDERGRPRGSYPVRNEEAIEIGSGKDLLYYQVRDSIYQGDKRGVVPKEFPKGTVGFYIMKYELTQGQYAYFLNTLDNAAIQNRVITGGRDYLQRKGSIVLENGIYRALSPGRPCNFISWDDACAFADFAGLRPFTEFEFEKAARGANRPALPAEYPWNTANKDKLKRATHKDGDYIMLNGMEESSLTDENRAYFGASYYWVMDLAGGVWERCITAGDSVGRRFKGTHGNGVLGGYGFADNKDWPQGNSETGGFGFRGGAFYTEGRAYHEVNPHSPIGFRNYGAWSGGNRSADYGSRFVRNKP